MDSDILLKSVPSLSHFAHGLHFDLYVSAPPLGVGGPLLCLLTEHSLIAESSCRKVGGRHLAESDDVTFLRLFKGAIFCRVQLYTSG
jgi:hypothetical protein